MGARNKSKYTGIFHKGQKFHEWTVIDENIVIENECKILCECSCLKTRRLVSVFTLLKGTSTKCIACVGKAKLGCNNPAWKGIGEVCSKILNRTKIPEERKALSKAWDKSNGKCSLTGRDIYLGDNASPDRIDSSIGYVEGNIQWVHKDVNIMKNMFDNDYFITMCHAVSRNCENPNVTKNKKVFGSH